VSGSLLVVRSGALTTVQDAGRRGVAHLGVPRAGALDLPAMRLANRLVGNEPDAAVLETTLDGVDVVLDVDRHLAITGAPAPVTVAARPAAFGLAVLARAGEVVEVGRADAGVRSYVAVAGGIDVPAVLGSRSTDVLAGLGPEPLRAGTCLPLGETVGRAPAVDFLPYTAPPAVLHLRCVLGPRDDELTAGSLELLAGASWIVSPDSNRIGLRLQGPKLERGSRRELPSEGVVDGSIQVPPDGQPVLFLADHPTTGGYPVVAVVPEPDIWSCAQARPGTIVQLHPGAGRSVQGRSTASR
jgi:biotin-dependent carboxylase-like uncharacterized protein